VNWPDDGKCPAAVNLALAYNESERWSTASGAGEGVPGSPGTAKTTIIDAACGARARRAVSLVTLHLRPVTPNAHAAEVEHLVGLPTLLRHIETARGGRLSLRIATL
jgi:hypothetical protein